MFTKWLQLQKEHGTSRWMKGSYVCFCNRETEQTFCKFGSYFATNYSNCNNGCWANHMESYFAFFWPKSIHCKVFAAPNFFFLLSFAWNLISVRLSESLSFALNLAENEKESNVRGVLLLHFHQNCAGSFTEPAWQRWHQEEYTTTEILSYNVNLH